MRREVSRQTGDGSIPRCGDLIDRVEVLIEKLVHGKHVDTVLFEHCTHGVVAANLALVAGILQLARFDVLPYLLYGLWARKLGFAEEFGERGGKGHWFLFEMLVLARCEVG
jgi:hypothetical protein